MICVLTSLPVSQFGPQVLDDLKAFVYESPHSAFATNLDDEDEDEDSDSEDNSEEAALDLLEDLDWPNTEWEDQVNPSAQAEQLEGFQDLQGHPHHGFPRLQRVRCNLTAMSQRYNVWGSTTRHSLNLALTKFTQLYFAAYADK